MKAVSQRLEALKVYLPGILIALLAFAFAWRYIEPAPPGVMRLAVGPAGSSYHWLGQRYAEVLKAQGLQVELVESGGSYDNLQRIRAGEADAGFVQSGVTLPDSEGEFFSLGSLYFEPLWVFTRGEQPLDDLMALQDKRIGIGEQHSGSNFLAHELLGQTGLVDKNTLVDNNRAEALLRGQLDVLFLVSSPNAPAVRQLLSAEKVRLMSFRRARGYTKHFPLLSELTLYEGAVDLAADLPQRDVRLLATTATLVVGKNFHPALSSVVLSAARDIHQQRGALQERDQFPTADYVSFALTREAEYFHENGPSFLQGRIPYKLAATLERVLIMLLPLLTVVLPLAKILPAIYAWRMKSKILAPYKELLELEGQREQDDFEQRLDQIEEKARALVSMPASYAPDIENLLLHIERLRGRKG